MNSLFDKNTWPWCEESDEFPELSEGNVWPKISVIIPSYNQGDFIEETLLSVVRQNYPNLELIVIDGGSTDNSVDIIRKHEKYITYWVSEKDRGQSHAINKGMSKATGEWIAWLNSDDCYLRNAFYYLFKETGIEDYEFLYGDYLTGESLSHNRKVQVISQDKLKFSTVIRFFYGIDYIIPSQSVFVRKTVADKVGYANEDFHYCMDVDWYARILQKGVKVLKYERSICFFRFNSTTKTGSLSNYISFENNKMGKEAEFLALKYSKQLGWFEKWEFNNLYDYYLMYSKEPQKYEQSSIWYLLKILFRHPFKTLKDRRLLGLFKRKLFRTY